MHLSLEEPVDVAVLFTHGNAKPVRVKWNGKMYAPTTVNMIHRTQEGEQEYIYFSVSDKTNAMKLRFNSTNMNWHIVELYTEG